ncbi:hypothetical protein ACFQZE_12105 [Paenibacillus sp. GCM10027627]|uniref:hypothetical protein n=1 Tax=unclassified Paenibacillus TaxID=185978 RepID=UPI003625A4C7
MKNRILCLIAAFAVLFMFGHEQTYAAPEKQKTVAVKLPTFDIRLNDVLISNTTSQYPLLVYNNITYYPMTYSDSRFMGVETFWNKQDGLSIKKGAFGNYQVYDGTLTDPNLTYEAKVITAPIQVNGKLKKNEQYPFLSFRNVTYFPLIWDYAVTEFGWTYKWSQKDGLSIKARAYVDSEKESVLNAINKMAVAKGYSFTSVLSTDTRIVQSVSGTYGGEFNNKGAACQFAASFTLSKESIQKTGLTWWERSTSCGDTSKSTVTIGSKDPRSHAGTPLIEDMGIQIMGEMRTAVEKVEFTEVASKENRRYTIHFVPSSAWKDRTLGVELNASNQVQKLVIKDFGAEFYTHTITFSNVK